MASDPKFAVWAEKVKDLQLKEQSPALYGADDDEKKEVWR